MKTLVLTVVASFAITASARAGTVIVDTTPGTATNDGTINVGEYVGGSSGVNSGFGNVIGSGSMLFVDSDVAGNLNFGLQTGGGNLNDRAVIYIDSVAGGFGDTSSFNDAADALRAAISGVNTAGTAGSQVTFPTGFQADYAIAFDQGFGGLWLLAAGGNNSLGFVGGTNLTPNNNAGAGAFEMSLLLSDIGVGAGGSFRYLATYGNPFDGNGFFRSDEFNGPASFPSGNPGQTSVSLGIGDFNTFTAVPVPEPLATLGGGTLLGLLALRRRP